MSLSRIKEIADALSTIEGLPVKHYEYYGTAERYCVWAEDSEYSSVEGDDYKLEQAIQGTIDLYTKEEFDPYAEQIQNVLKSAKISFYLNSTQYEDETEFIHYEWVWTI